MRLRISLAAVVAASAVGTGAAPAHAASGSCGFGTGGTAASGLCWLDMSAYDDAAASSPAGQDMSVAVLGGYTVGFTVRTAPVSGASSRQTIASSALPTYANSYLGTTAYAGTPGKPALYTTGDGSGSNRQTRVTLSGIVVQDASGTVVHDYTFAAADAESTNIGEGLAFSSDQALNLLASYSPAAGAEGCQNSVTGLGTTTVRCSSGTASAGGETGAIVLAATEPTTVSADLMTVGGRQAVAFALGVAHLTATEAVAGRVNPADSFDLTTTSPYGATVGTASTGTANTASTGPVTVVPETAGHFELGQAASAGSPTPLSEYQQSWSCTDATTGATTALPSGVTGPNAAVRPATGDDITCTVTNSPVDAGPNPTVHLKVTAGPSNFGDDDSVLYDVKVANLGPDTATGVVVRVTGWICEPAYPNCRKLPDRHDPSAVMDTELPMRGPIASGAEQEFPVQAYLPDTNPGSLRVTVEVVHSDQTDTASVPGTCRDGANPQDDCASVVESLR